MPTSFRKYLKRKKRKAFRRSNRRIDPKYTNAGKDLTKREQEINELLLHGEVPTTRREDGTVVLREITGEDGDKVADDSIDQLVPVDLFQQKYDEIEVDNIIDNKIEEILPDSDDVEDKINQFFLDYELLKNDIDAVGSDKSHQHLIDGSERFIPTPEPVKPIPTGENILGNGTFEDGELPKITSKGLNHQIIDDPTEIRPTAKILRLWGTKPGHIIIHKKEDAKLKRGGLYECSYLIYVHETYDGTHGVEFTKWGNLDPDLTVMTPIGTLPYDANKKIIKGRWIKRNFWVKIPHRGGEPTDFSWKLGYPMGRRPKGVNPGDAIGSGIYKIKLLKNYGKPSKEEFSKHKRLGMLWKEMDKGNIGHYGGTFEGLSKFFEELQDEMNSNTYRASIMGTEVRTELKRTVKQLKKNKFKIIEKDVPVDEGKEEVGKTVHKLSIHDMGKYFEIWFALKDISKIHHKKILEDILKRFDSLTWHPSDPPQEMFDEPREMFDPSAPIVEPPQIQVVTQAAPPPNINIKQPEIGMKMDGVSVKQDGAKIDVPVGVGSSTGVSTDVAGSSLSSTTGKSDSEIRNMIQAELSKIGVGSSSSASAKKPAPKKKAAPKKPEPKGWKKVEKKAKDAVKKAGRFLRRAFRFRRRRRRRRRRRSDLRLKRNIMFMGQSKSGLNIYEYNYLWSNKKYRGVMAQELLKVKPEAVSKSLGFYSVDYDMIDVNFERVNNG